jgi:hypothetical protein
MNPADMTYATASTDDDTPIKSRPKALPKKPVGGGVAAKKAAFAAKKQRDVSSDILDVIARVLSMWCR